MLIIDGFIESGVFIPEKPLTNIKGRQKAVLHIEDEFEKQNRITAWKEFSQAIKSCDEILEGEPERIRFRTPEDIEAL